MWPIVFGDGLPFEKTIKTLWLPIPTPPSYSNCLLSPSIRMSHLALARGSRTASPKCQTGPRVKGTFMAVTSRLESERPVAPFLSSLSCVMQRDETNSAPPRSRDSATSAYAPDLHRSRSANRRLRSHDGRARRCRSRSEEHTSELQSPKD